MSNTTNDWMAEYKAEAQRRAKRLAAAKRPLLAALKRARIAAVEIAYDGEGDSGQVGDIAARDRAGKPAELRGSLLLDLDGKRRRYLFDQALHDFTWEVLAVYHDGFEDNDGGFGTLSIDVAEGTFTLDHNHRFIDVTNTQTEV